MDFDWVTERANCSLVKIFEILRLGSTADVQLRNNIRSGDSVKFEITENGNHFAVFRDGVGGRSSVKFTLNETQIVIETPRRSFTAALTLNNKGKCRLSVNDEELKPWQVRSMALEALFFE